MAKEKAAIYCRLSKEDDEKLNKGDDSESIVNQILLLTDYAKSQGWDIYDIYRDDDRKGFDRERPEFNRLLKEAEKGVFNIVLCKHQSRFTRDMETAERYLHREFILWGIRFVSVVDHVDTNIKGNKKARQINALINEWYSEDLSDSIKRVFESKMRAGQFLGSFAPFGYMKDPNDRHKLIVDEEAAEIVREIFNLYLQGYGCTQISSILMKNAVQTPSAYKKQKGLKFKNPNCGRYSENFGIWSNNTVKKILQNETYIGRLIQGKERKISYKSKKMVITPREEWIIIDNNHEAIIEQKTFNMVQTLMSNKRNVHKPKDGYKGVESSHILAGKIVCLNCGSSLHRGSTGRNGVRYLRCKLSKKSKNNRCTPHSIKLDRLVEIVDEKIKGLIQNYISDDRNASTVIDSFINIEDTKKIIESKEKELNICDAKVQEILRTVANAYTDKVKGIISEADFVNLKQVYNEDMENFKNKKIHLEKEMEEMKVRHKSLKDVDNLLNKYLNFGAITHEIVNDFIDNIQVGEKDKTGEQTIIINWVF